MKNTNILIKTENHPIQYYHGIEQVREEFAWRYKWITTGELRKQIEGQKSSYYSYIKNLIK